ncbi:MAG: DNA recombination protein RmuC [Hyphomicrobiales bacterium]
MTLNQPDFATPSHAITVNGTVSVAIGVLLVALIVVVFALALALWRATRERRESARQNHTLHDELAEIRGQLRSLAQMAAQRDSHITQTLDRRLDQVSSRLGQNLSESAAKTGESLGKLNERLAVIDAAQSNIAELTTRMVGLQNVLANKQARGAFGQARMEAIIRDGLPASAYSFQDGLSNNTRPDCVIHLPETPLKLVIDAKFPLEAFNALKAAHSDAESHAGAKRLRRDVGVHIKDVARKYLISGETHDTAILFVPSEAVYAELYENFEDLIQKAYRAGVIFASPNILMLVVQMVMAMFRDTRMREQAGVIKSEVGLILRDVARLDGRIGDLQRHFAQASQDIEKIVISSGKIAKRGARIELVEFENDRDLADPDKGAPQPPHVAEGAPRHEHITSS